MVASDTIQRANKLFAVILVFEYSISDNVIKFSPSTKDLPIPSDADFLYLMYSVSYPSSDSISVNLLITVAVTPEVSPCMVISLSAKYFVYDLTGIFRKVGSIRTEKYEVSKKVPPGITMDPSLKKYCPNLSIWFCNIDWRVVNSLDWIGNPGLNKTLL